MAKDWKSHWHTGSFSIKKPSCSKGGGMIKKIIWELHMGGNNGQT